MGMAEERLHQLRETIKQRILPSDFDQLNCSVITPLVYYGDQRETNTREPRGVVLGGLMSDFAELLRIVLRHLPANPSEQGNVEAYETIYTFPAKREDITQFEKEYYPNLELGTTKQFLKKLIELARQGRELRKNVNNQVDTNLVDRSAWKMWLANSKIALVGYRGVGKTTFLNYLMTVHGSALDDARVILIRIDLTKPYLDVKLTNWYRWQFCDILFRYYDRKKLGMDLSLENARLVSRLAEHYHGDRKTLLLDYVKARHLIEGSPEPVAIPEWLFRGIADYLSVDLDTGFIFVFDGLDRLGLTKDDQKAFKEKVKAVRKALMKENTLPAAYVVTMRWQTFFEISGSDPYRLMVKKEIRGVPTHLIFENKVRRLERRHLFLPSIRFPAAHRIGESVYRQYVREVAYAFLRFVAYSVSPTQQETLSATPEELCDVLDHIFKPDTRGLFEALESLVSGFMHAMPSEELDRMMQQATEQELLGTVEPALLESIGYAMRQHLPDLYARAYVIIEDLMLGSYAYHHPEYWYKVIFKRDAIGLEKDRNRESRATIMNVFYYPHSSRSGEWCLLAGVRILQFVRARMHAHSGELVTFLRGYFRYPEYVTWALLEDMIYSHLIVHPVTEEHEVEDEVRLAALGEYLLGRLLKTLEYIGVALESAPVPVHLVKQEAFPIASYNRSLDFVCNNKVVSAINFVRLLKDLENLEQKEFDKQSVTKKPAVGWECFAIADEIAEGVFDGISGLVVDAYQNPKRENLKSALEDVLIRNPKRHFPSMKEAPLNQESRKVERFATVEDQGRSSENRPGQENRPLSETIRSMLQGFYTSGPTRTIEERDRSYESSFDGVPKAKDVLAYAANFPLDQFAYVSIGGADGSEVSHFMHNSTLTHGILVETSDYGTEEARKRKIALARESKELIVIQGDAMQRLPDCADKLREWEEKGYVKGVILSIQSTLHELPYRSPEFDPNVLLGKIFEPFRHRIFFCREPAKVRGWPSRVHLRIPVLDGNDLLAVSRQINDKLIFNDRVENLADDFVQMSDNLAVETLLKILYCVDSERYKYEMNERLTAFNPEKFTRILRLYITPTENVEFNYLITDTFRAKYKKYQVEARSTTGDKLGIPEAFVRIVGSQ